MKKSTAVGSMAAAIIGMAGATPLAYADVQPEFSATAQGGIDSVQVEIQRPSDFRSACRAYGVPAGADPATSDTAFDSGWLALWGVAGNDRWGWAMPANSIPNGDYDVYWACWDLNEDDPRFWGSDPARQDAVDDLSAPLHITIKPESERETGTIGEGPIFGDYFGSLDPSSLTLGS